MTRRGYVSASVAGATLLGLASLVALLPPKLIWNASASVPLGLYAIGDASALRRGDLVAVAPPEPWTSFLAEGGYLPRGVPLLKPVAALPGQQICRRGAIVAIDGVPVAAALAHDRLRRPLPVWRGCHTLRQNELFLLNPHVSASLDGRYFGPFPARVVLGRAHPLYTDANGDGRFVWRAPLR